MSKKNVVSIGLKSFLVVLLLVSFSSLAVAQPNVPHAFYGDVIVNGGSAPNNLFVEARVSHPDGTSTFTTVTSDGGYGYDPVFYVEPGTANWDNRVITFFVEGVEAGSYVFSSGNVTRVDLQADGVDLPSPGNGGTGTTGGGGAGTAGVPPAPSDDEEDDDGTGTTPTVVEEECVPNWVCSEWTDCVNYQQRRVCIDRNECGSDEGKPDERQSCEMTEEQLTGTQEPQQAGLLSAITGFVTGAGAVAPWIGLIVLLALIAGLYLFVFSRRK